MNKKIKITPVMQTVAADILTRFMFIRNMDDVMKVYDEVFEAYGLHEDPFTGVPCTTKEYFENRAEYNRQLMIEKYGHCDGLE